MEKSNRQPRIPRCRVLMLLLAATLGGLLTVTRDKSMAQDLQTRPLQAHWVSSGWLLWNVSPLEGSSAQLHGWDPGNPDAGRQNHELRLVPEGPPEEILQLRPHLRGLNAYRLELDREQVRRLLKGEVWVSLSRDGEVALESGIQTAGVLDHLYRYEGPLGPLVLSGTPSLRLWAPTARNVRLLLYPDTQTSEPEPFAMVEDPDTGVWAVVGSPEWNRKFYLYEVEVFVPATGKVERNRVTDPYSLSLAADSRLSQIIQLSDPDLMPPRWELLHKPPLETHQQSIIYELHIRDFSISDKTVPAALRGRFGAFAVDSAGVRHLRGLARAGVTHLHLLPAFDVATIPELSSNQAVVTEDLNQHPPDSERQQRAIEQVRSTDGFNWGYDPYHYTVPEGSYAEEPDGEARIREFRRMVQALNQAGLRVVMDVVYNHTHLSGQNPRSVLDRIVPGYYHRLDLDGAVATSSCCPNTATEHRMMEKLMLDSVLTWAREYKVDGFRFDLMGHHLRSNLVKLREELNSLTLWRDGVDGRAIVLYGEGWDFGEVAGNARGVNATQKNMAGTLIGTFNDRLRDGVRGGTPFSEPRDQGFVTGLLLASNGSSQGDEKELLLRVKDWIRIGLAGGLAHYRLVNFEGQEVRGEQVQYLGSPAGYTRHPVENVLYVSAHDNESLWDAIQIKAATSVSVSERVRMQVLALSLVALGQGIPFFHAGSDMLRSKSLDRDSFDSGDWFNRLDFSFQTNNWGVGLPPAEKNRQNWDWMRPLLRDASLQPGPDQIARASQLFREFLRIRRSSPLFSLPDAAAIQQHMAFHNTGPEQLPAIISFGLTDPEGRFDRRNSHVLVVVNASAEAGTLPNPYPGVSGILHPIQQQSADAIARGSSMVGGTLTVPGRTTAVFLVPRSL